MEFQVHESVPRGTKAKTNSKYSEAWNQLTSHRGAISLPSSAVTEYLDTKSDVRRLYCALRHRALKGGYFLRTSFAEGRRYFWIELKDANL